jgi:hypothetical protein
MPNWVYNNLSIEGEEAQAIKEKLVKVTEEGVLPLSLMNIISPTDMERYRKVVGSGDPENYAHPDNWYNWNIRNWGTKWDVGSPAIVEDTPEKVSYTFDTAWSAPYEAIRALSSLYPTTVITLEWEEEQGYGATTQFLAGDESELESHN